MAATASPFGPAPTITAGSRAARRTPRTTIASERRPAELEHPRQRGSRIRATAKRVHDSSGAGATRRPPPRPAGAQLPQAMAEIGVRPPVEHPGNGRHRSGSSPSTCRHHSGRQVRAGADRERERAVRARVHVDRVPVAISRIRSARARTCPPRPGPRARRRPAGASSAGAASGLRIARVAGVRMPRAVVARERLAEQRTAGEHSGERHHPAVVAALDEPGSAERWRSPAPGRRRPAAQMLLNRRGGVTLSLIDVCGFTSTGKPSSRATASAAAGRRTRPSAGDRGRGARPSPRGRTCRGRASPVRGWAARGARAVRVELGRTTPAAARRRRPGSAR